VHATADTRMKIHTAPNRLPLVATAAAVGCALLFVILIVLRPRVPAADPATGAMLDDILLWNSMLPRAAIALIAGAALGLSGALLQRVLRNPIADASTLGIGAGAQLALTAALGFSPLLLGFSRELVAFGGGLTAILIVLALSWRHGLDPVTVAISGMIVSMVAAAISVTIILARGEYAMDVYIWGAGSLSQQDWSGVTTLLPRLAIGILAALLLQRPLNLLALDDAAAKSLGVALHAARLGILVLAVWLAASVTANVGLIGFLGLAAPAIARFLGARTTRQVMIAAPVAGAGLLLFADCLTQLLGPGFTDLAPTGAATALIGGPLLVLLLGRIHGFSAATAKPAALARRLANPGRILLLLLVGIAVAITLALCLAPTVNGWQFATGALFADLLPFRLPRIVAAGGAGGMLAAAGFIIQRLTANPIASPEVLGVAGGAGAGLTILLLVAGISSPPVMILAMGTGALVAFLFVIGIAARGGLNGERLLLAGIAIGALTMAMNALLLAQGGTNGFILLMWMAGSTNRAGLMEASVAIASLVVLVAPILPLSRWLAIMPLGRNVASSIGLPVKGVYLVLAILAALMTAISSFLVGPLSLVGLVAPHLTRLIGFNTPRHQLLASVLLGGGLLIVADWLSRIVIYPYQVPVGLFAALLGGPYLLWLLTRKD